MTTMETDQNVERVHFETADELLRAVSPVCCLETDTPNPSFIFRGHGDISWELVPKALRLTKAGITEALAHVEPMLRMQSDDQVLAEFLLLQSFMFACDRAVIALPGDSHQFRKVWMNLEAGHMEQALKHPHLWPHDEQFAMLAFAQHHGIPTSLLDWTRSSIVAAYFAAEASWRLGLTAHLEIWALNTEMLGLSKSVSIVAMPGANSARLGSQRGLFTCVRQTARRGEPIGDVSLPAALANPDQDRTKPRPLWRLTLPAKESVRLLYLCHLNGVDGSTVFPGPAGAASATLERAAWLRKDPETGRSTDEVRPVSTHSVRSQRT